MWKTPQGEFQVKIEETHENKGKKGFVKVAQSPDLANFGGFTELFFLSYNRVTNKSAREPKRQVIALGMEMKLMGTVLCLLIGTWWDLKTYHIPNRLIWMGFTLGWVALLPNISWMAMLQYVMGIVVPFVLCWFIYRIRGIGAGDVKLFMIMGCFHGSKDVMYCIALSFLFGAGISLSRLLNHKKLRISLQRSLLYFQDRILEKKIVPYEVEEKEIHQIHFSISILLGYLTWMGVKSWLAVPFY